MIARWWTLAAALLAACGVQGSPFLDGDRPISIRRSPWPESAIIAQSQWNPFASGPPQTVEVTIDSTDRCSKNPELAGYALVGLVIVRCPDFSPANQNEELWFLAHELGHLLGGGHLSGSGNVMCARCPPVWQYTAADEAEICKLGRGGRCRAFGR